MVFITRCWKNAPLEAGAKRSRLRGLLLMALMLVALCAALPAARAAGAANAATAQLTQLRTQSADDGIYLSANVDFELPNVVEDALLKGIPLFFVLEVEILRDRWYWTDQRVAAASRTIQLAYQPLTRRWRVNIGSGIIAPPSTRTTTPWPTPCRRCSAWPAGRSPSHLTSGPAQTTAWSLASSSICPSCLDLFRLEWLASVTGRLRSRAPRK